MKRLLWVVVALWPLLVAQAFGGKSFTAETVMSSKGGPEMVSRIYVGGQDRWRVEPAGQPQAQIVRLDRKVMYTLLTAARSYYEMPMSEEDAKAGPTGKPYPQGKLTRKFLGKEAVGGRPTRKFEVTVTAAGQKPQVMYEWWSDELAAPLRLMSADGSWSMEYRSVKIGPQDAKLFEVPAGYTKLTIPGLPQPGVKKR